MFAGSDATAVVVVLPEDSTGYMCERVQANGGRAKIVVAEEFGPRMRLTIVTAKVSVEDGAAELTLPATASVGLSWTTSVCSPTDRSPSR